MTHRSGELIKAGDVDQLIKVVRDLLSHPDKLEEDSKGAYEAAQKYSFTTLVNRWRDFLRQERLLTK